MVVTEEYLRTLTIGDNDPVTGAYIRRKYTQAEIDWELANQPTAEEITLNAWQNEMVELDNQITKRMIEDIYDFATGVTSVMPENIVNLMAARKSKRADKP